METPKLTLVQRSEFLSLLQPHDLAVEFSVPPKGGSQLHALAQQQRLWWWNRMWNLPDGWNNGRGESPGQWRGSAIPFGEVLEIRRCEGSKELCFLFLSGAALPQSGINPVPGSAQAASLGE